jgi:hypothetical protein
MRMAPGGDAHAGLADKWMGSTPSWFKPPLVQSFGGQKHCWFESTMAANLCHDDPDLAHFSHRRWAITASGDISVF